MKNLELESIIDNRYEVKSFIGSGASSSVYLCFDKFLNRSVAIKVLNNFTNSENSKEFLQRFQQEAVALTRLNHDNIVQIFHVGFIENNKFPYLVMEYVEGKALNTLIKELNNFNYYDSVCIAIEIAKALSEAHHNNILHRDLKPQNIIVTKQAKNFKIKLLDFGLCKITDKKNHNDTTLTKPGQLLGTPSYMSPEQCLGKKITKSSDIYSFGCIFYEMITGQTPYQAESIPELLRQHLSSDIPRFADKISKSQVAEKIQNIVLRCTEKSSEERYISINDLLIDLEKLLPICTEEKYPALDFNLNTQTTHSKKIREIFLNKYTTRLLLNFSAITIFLITIFCIYSLLTIPGQIQTTKIILSDFSKNQKYFYLKKFFQLCTHNLENKNTFELSTKIIEEEQFNSLTISEQIDFSLYIYENLWQKFHDFEKLSKLSIHCLNLLLDDLKPFETTNFKSFPQERIIQLKWLCENITNNCREKNTWKKIYQVLNKRPILNGKSLSLKATPLEYLSEFNALATDASIKRVSSLKDSLLYEALQNCLHTIEHAINQNNIQIAEKYFQQLSTISYKTNIPSSLEAYIFALKANLEAEKHNFIKAKKELLQSNEILKNSNSNMNLYDRELNYINATNKKAVSWK